MHSNTSIETIKILILDPIPLASMIERKAKPYLKEIKPIVKEKISITKENRYDDKNFNNRKKYKETCLKMSKSRKGRIPWNKGLTKNKK